MWFDPVGIFPWKPVAKFLLIALCITLYIGGLAYVIVSADYREDRHNKTEVLCQDKVVKMKLAPSEARIAYDLCKETDGRLP